LEQLDSAAPSFLDLTEAPLELLARVRVRPMRSLENRRKCPAERPGVTHAELAIDQHGTGPESDTPL
jgi:hypothetical protein